MKTLGKKVSFCDMSIEEYACRCSCSSCNCDQSCSCANPVLLEPRQTTKTAQNSKNSTSLESQIFSALNSQRQK